MKAWSDEPSCAIGWWPWQAPPCPADGDDTAPAVVRSAGDRRAWNVKTPAGQRNHRDRAGPRLSSLIMVRDAVRAGVGAGRLPVSLVSHDLADGSLVHWGDIEGAEIALWTLYPSRRLLSARVSAFLDYLKAAFPMGTPDELAAHIGK